MKIAVQMFGHLRTYKKCASMLKKHLLDNYDCDVFMHTWDSVDHMTQTWHNYRISPDKKLTPSELEKEVRKSYSITDMKMEKQIVKDLGTINAIGKDISLFGMKSMLHGISEATRLREKFQKQHKIKYDFVLTIRPDILLKESFEIKKFLERLTEQEIKKGYFIGGFQHLTSCVL